MNGMILAKVLILLIWEEICNYYVCLRVRRLFSLDDEEDR